MHTKSHRIVTTTWNNLVDAAWRGVAAPARMWRRHRDLTRLAQLNQYQLKDIGLTRADVEWAMSAPADANVWATFARRRETRIAATERRARAIAATQAGRAGRAADYREKL